VKRIITELRAIWESGGNLESRIRALAAHALLQASPDNARIMLDTSLHPTIRIDAMKAHAKIAGVDYTPAAARGGGGSLAEGAQFAVNIVFANAGKVESITTVGPLGRERNTIDGGAIDTLDTADGFRES
jgi:hypothetical protein